VEAFCHLRVRITALNNGGVAHRSRERVYSLNGRFEPVSENRERPLR